METSPNRRCLWQCAGQEMALQPRASGNQTCSDLSCPSLPCSLHSPHPPRCTPQVPGCGGRQPRPAHALSCAQDPARPLPGPVFPAVKQHLGHQLPLLVPLPASGCQHALPLPPAAARPAAGGGGCTAADAGPGSCSSRGSCRGLTDPLCNYMCSSRGPVPCLLCCCICLPYTRTVTWKTLLTAHTGAHTLHNKEQFCMHVEAWGRRRAPCHPAALHAMAWVGGGIRWKTAGQPGHSASEASFQTPNPALTAWAPLPKHAVACTCCTFCTCCTWQLAALHFCGVCCVLLKGHLFGLQVLLG